MADSLRLHADITGRDSTGMLLIHPNPLDSTYWLYQAAHLSTWYTVISVDLPGYGHSPRLTHIPTMPELASAVWETLERAEVDRVVVAGVSIGASIALHIAAQQPLRCRAVVLSGCGYRTTKTFAGERISGYRTRGLAYRARHLRDGLSPAFQSSEAGRLALRMADARAELCDVPSVIRLFEAHGQPDPPWLFEAQQPIQIISGTHDYAHQAALELHRRLPTSEFIALDGAGHACNLEQPWEWDRLLLDFLERHT